MATRAASLKTLTGSILRGVSWATYAELRDQPKNGHLRMSYLDGTLFIMSPSYYHDFYGRRLALLVDLVTEAFRTPIQGTATTTLRRKGDDRRKGSAKEPDYGFYFGQNARRMNHRGEHDLDLDVDPPPDLAIEVDYKADSAKALAIYARLGIPEVWRYKPRRKILWIGRLVDETYETIDRGLNFPRLTPSLVRLALDRMAELGETESKFWIREWVVGLPEPEA